MSGKRGEQIQTWVLCSSLAKEFNDWLGLHARGDTDSDSVGSGELPEAINPGENHDHEDATFVEDNELSDTHGAAPDSDNSGGRWRGARGGAWCHDNTNDAKRWKFDSSHTWWDASPDK